jgi:four helix bundle protein
MYSTQLTARVEEYGKTVIRYAKLIPKGVLTLPLISQFIRSGTSVGANYFEADEAESKNDYIHKVGIAKIEARETGYWIKMIVEAEPKLKSDSLTLAQETKELCLIFNAIINKVRSTNSK